MDKFLVVYILFAVVMLLMFRNHMKRLEQLKSLEIQLRYASIKSTSKKEVKPFKKPTKKK